jgi:hypothetical protein
MFANCELTARIDGAAAESRRDIREILSRRTDLSAFLVHLSRDSNGTSAKDNLQAILRSRRLEARNPFGSAFQKLRVENLCTDSQKCVCFTETPLEHVSLLLGEIDGRRYDFKPYGLAITKMQGRRRGVNPVWYLDISRRTDRRDWLMKDVEKIIDEAIRSGEFDETPIAKLSPFIEQMGSGENCSTGKPYTKEFWWEREWRHVGDFDFPKHCIVFCPEAEIARFDECVESINEESERIRPAFVDPQWSLEQIIGRLAGFSLNDLGPF